MDNHKTCSKCKTLKPYLEFPKCKKNTTGYSSWCKECGSLLEKEYRHTIPGLISKVHHAQVINSRRRQHPPPVYTRKELLNYAINLPEFHVIYNDWINSNYKKWLTPSFDRVNNDMSYTFQNIQITTWENNFFRELNKESDSSRHVSITSRRAIRGINIKTGESISFISLMDAQKELNIKNKDISLCCNNKRKTAGGYTWAFI